MIVISNASKSNFFYHYDLKSNKDNTKCETLIELHKKQRGS